MNDRKSLSTALEELLALSPANRAKKKPSDGFEEVAKTIIEKAIEDRDSPMLKYISDLIEKKSEKPVKETTVKTKFDAFTAIADQGIDEEG